MYGVLLGIIFQVIINFILITISKEHSLTERLKFVNEFKIFFREYIIILFSSAFSSINILVDQIIATSLPAGSLAYISYGDKVVSAIISILTTTLGIIILPEYSHLVSKNAYEELLIRFKLDLRKILIFSGTISILLCIFSYDIVRLIWERGAFTSLDSIHVSVVQTFYTFKIPFILSGILIARLISAFKLNYYLILVSLLNLISNLVLGITLANYLGIIGIPIASFLVFLLSYLVLCSISHRIFKDKISFIKASI